MSLRTTTQALIGCQSSENGEICSYKAINDSWVKDYYQLNKVISVNNLGTIEWTDENSDNRGFTLTFAQNYPAPMLRGLSFIGGMVTVNFDQNANNTLNICKKPN